MAKTTKFDDKGYKCECGIYHPHPYYVFAHMDTELVHTCGCGRKHTILNGIVELIQSSAPSKKLLTRT